MTGEARIELFGKSDVPVAGTSHRQDVLARIAGDALRRGEHVAFTALLVPEPLNPHDPNAIAVIAENHGPVGYFGRRDAVRYRYTLNDVRASLRAGANTTAEAVSATVTTVNLPEVPAP